MNREQIRFRILEMCENAARSNKDGDSKIYLTLRSILATDDEIMDRLSYHLQRNDQELPGFSD